ncbi:GHKL domain-containing protein [Clostridium autoethanogenum]|uniref:GHKL domain-containing protein n=1 Tax=Clostridium autoethanogenum TaxID=84023 RepID=UPI00242E6063|nr:GHKL domain-containing protein [Clostridium autoethanogenum]
MLEDYLTFFKHFLSNFLFDAYKNSMKGYIKEKHISTDKGDYVNHGIGMMSIQSIADKYLGTTYIESRENMFILNIMFQI